MASIINASTTSGLVITPDQSGVLQLQSGSNTATMPAATGTVMVSGNMPTFAAYNNSAAFSVSTNTNTTLPADTKEWDTIGAFNNTASTVTLNGLSVPAYSYMPNIAGYYQVNACLWTPTASGGPLAPKIMKNGSQYRAGSTTALTTVTNNLAVVSSVVYLNGTTDYISIMMYQGSGGTLNCNNASPSYNYFNAALIRSA